MHAQLATVDPDAAARIKPNDSQRIQRALEVYRASGRTLTDWQAAGRTDRPATDFVKLAVIPGERKVLHRRIADRLQTMLRAGFVEEVRRLMRRPGLKAESPAMRSVGYRQIWAALEGELDLVEAADKALYATRQLAKRQLTWLRSESGLNAFDPLEDGVFDAISAFLREQITE